MPVGFRVECPAVYSLLAVREVSGFKLSVLAGIARVFRNISACRSIGFFVVSCIDDLAANA